MQDGAAGGDIHGLLRILADGEEQARQLGETDGLQSLPEEHYRGVARQLQCTFGKAIAVARSIEAAGASGSRGTDRSDSPRSADESSGRTARDAQERQDMCKRRKGLPKWTKKFRVPDANLDATPDDGFSWRKYGQKDILGAKFPRGYYRCTYRNAQGCPATKQVQRSDSDLSVFDVTYQGVHTCHQRQRHAAASPPGAAAAHGGSELQDPSLELLASFKSGLQVETEGLTLTEASFHERDHDAAAAAAAAAASFSFPFPSVPFDPPVRPQESAAAAFSPVEGGRLGGGFPSEFVSPAASSYFSMAHCPVGSYERGSVGMPGAESELGEVVSAATASTVDPAGFDYSLYHHHADLDPHLPFAPAFGGHPSHGQHRNP